MIIRFSDADVIVPELSHGLNPSVAFKFLRDGVSSANQFGMVAFETETQEGEWDFFSHNFQSHLPEHTGECGPKSIANYFGAAFTHIFTTGSYDMAKYDESGEEVDLEDINFPFYLRFVPVGKSEGDIPTTEEGDETWFEQLEGDAIPAGTELFHVYAMDTSPACSGQDCVSPTPQSIDTTELDLIGTITTTTEFTQSLWGDEHLYFQHGHFIHDINPDIGGDEDFKYKDMLRYDTDTWGLYPIDDWAPPETTDEEVLAGIVSSGCPFQWIIDGLAEL